MNGAMILFLLICAFASWKIQGLIFPPASEGAVLRNQIRIQEPFCHTAYSDCIKSHKASTCQRPHDYCLMLAPRITFQTLTEIFFGPEEKLQKWRLHQDELAGTLHYLRSLISSIPFTKEEQVLMTNVSYEINKHFLVQYQQTYQFWTLKSYLKRDQRRGHYQVADN